MSLCNCKNRYVTMRINYIAVFFLQKLYGNNIDTSEAQIRFYVKFGKEKVTFNVGYTINPSKWDKDNSRVKKNTTNKNGISAKEINAEIQRLENLVDDVIRMFEVQDLIPKAKEFKDAFNLANGKDTGKEIKLSVQYCFQEYILEMAKKKSWSDSTFAKQRGIKNNLKAFDDNLSVDKINTGTLSKYHDYLVNERGMQNTSIKRHLSFLNSFFKWCNEKDYLMSEEWKKFKPEIKTVKKNHVVFLTWDELIRLYHLEFPENKKYLERVRDVFCFQCFTSLRFSDVSQLKRTDVFQDHIRVVTEKTDHELIIDLNERAKAILLKYKDEEYPNNLALPVISNQKSNKWIKECCFLAKIDTPMTSTYYKGNERIDETKPKYELMGTHSGRRTFICNALILGIQPEIVMKWTGHSDYM